MINFIIQKEESDQTIISFLKKKFKSTPLSLIHKLFRTKKIKVNGENIRYYHHRLKIGEKIIIADTSLKIHQPSASSPIKTEIDLKIIYEDNNILIVLKEHNVEIHSSSTNNCLNNAVRNYLYQQNPIQYQKLVQSLFVFNAVHRLDKLTKGLIIYPKNPATKKVLHDAINDKEKITKKYLAICASSVKKQLTKLPKYISGYLWKNEKEKKMEFFSNYEKKNSKSCMMEVKKISKEIDQLLLEITLHTGRKHQIRSTLSYFGWPIVGDKKYSSKIVLKDKIYLFAYKILFNNLPLSLSYLNGKEFTIEGLEKVVINLLNRNIKR